MSEVFEEHITTDDGKYTVVIRSNGTSTALRYGEAHPAYEGIRRLDNLTLALAHDLQATQEKLAECRKDLADHTAVFGTPSDLIDDLETVINDSLDIDWTTKIAARDVVGYLLARLGYVKAVVTELGDNDDPSS